MDTLRTNVRDSAASVDLAQVAGTLEAQPITRLVLCQTREQALIKAIQQIQQRWFVAVFAGDEVAVARLEAREALARRELVRIVGNEDRAA